MLLRLLRSGQLSPCTPRAVGHSATRAELGDLSRVSAFDPVALLAARFTLPAGAVRHGGRAATNRTPAMTAIQQAILETMKACLAELQRAHPGDLQG